MKKSHIITLAVCLLALAIPASALAGKQRAKRVGGENKEARPGQVLKRYDTNRNHKIDGDEREALRKGFVGNTALKALDTNRDGQLDDHEIDSIKAKKRADKGAAKTGKRKKAKIF